MPRITKITSQKKSGRANVYLDEQFAFGIDLDNLVKFDLRVEKELTQDEVERIVKEAELVKTLGKLLNFATTRPRSEKEIRGWFGRKKVHQSLYGKLKKKLKKFGLLDDEKFAKWWVQQRLSFKPKSRKEITFELRGKGIDKNTIDDVLAGSGIDDLKNAKKLLAKVGYKWQRFDDTKRRQKKAEYLARKGFGWDVIKVVTAS